MSGPVVDFEGARAQLAEAVERFPLAVRLLRRSLFRQHLALNVDSATPFLGIVAQSEGVDFDEAAWFIEPPRAWPERPLPTDARATAKGIDRAFDFTPSQIWQRHRMAGTIVRDYRKWEHLIGIRVLGGGIELTAIDGGLKLETFHGLARILLDAPLPATVAIAVCGRLVGDVLDHRWLRGQPWKVLRVEEDDARTGIVFETGREPWTAPWPAVWGARLGGMS